MHICTHKHTQMHTGMLAHMQVYPLQYTHTRLHVTICINVTKFYKDPVQYLVFILQIMKLKYREGKTLI